MKENGLNKKIILFASIGGVAVIAAVVAIILIFTHKKEEYRLIKVYKTEGEVIVSKLNSGDINAYENMILESGDRIKVNKGLLTLKLDDDKYIYAIENTEFELLVSGNAADSKTSINLIEGTITNEIQNKLSDQSYYEVNTPNSTMSVRGTIFTASTYIGALDGIRYTDVFVTVGIVDTIPINGDKTESGESRLLHQSEFISIYTDDKNKSHFCDTMGRIDVTKINLGAGGFDTNTVKSLKGLMDENSGYTNNQTNEEPEEEEEIEEETEVTVSFMYNNQEFGTQTVISGEKVKRPLLQPAETGDWDYDFNEPVEENISINWK